MIHYSSCEHVTNLTVGPLQSVLSSKKRDTCSDCAYEGIDLWVCLFKNCLHMGCSENSHDHSTHHNLENPTHCIQMNMTTKRYWCYECNSEIVMEARCNGLYDSDQEMDGTTYKSRDSGHGSYSTLRNSPERAHVFAFEKTVGLNVGMSGDASEASDVEDSADDRTDRPFGLVGLQNIGNTCYMNAALQALSNTIPLTHFFLECSAIVQSLSDGKKPGLSRTFQALIREIWKKNGGYVVPSGILYGIRNVHPMFRGYSQHDTQEFLRNFMDQLHEELKQVASPECSSLPDSDTFSLAMDEPAISSSYDSSEGEYETCDSGVSERSSLSDDTERPSSCPKRRPNRSLSPNRRIWTRLPLSNMILDSQPIPNSTYASNVNKKQQKFRSIISDIFDGKLLSSVQCLTCDRVSSRIETFQDLSLPIPSKDHLLVLHGRPTSPGVTCSEAVISVNDGWMAWILAWLKSWFYGPIVTLHDCLAAFFSTDELKGDNMYSCEKCNKLRNGIKFSKVLQLPEVLCIHLKRFRHEVMFSCKISSAVSFPLTGLEMKPYLHAECVSKVSTYELFSVICHHGTAGGGHYISYALNEGHWYEFDDQYVTRVSHEKVQSVEAYVLFYRKVSTASEQIRHKAVVIAKSHSCTPTRAAYISKQWLSRFNTCTEVGPIDNSDFLCQHGLVHPDKELQLVQWAAKIPLDVYEYLYKVFGGCSSITSVHICPACVAFNNKILLEMENFASISREIESKELPPTHLMSVAWFNQWHKFVYKRTPDPPGPIDNTKININLCDINEYEEIHESLWKFFHSIYGGGPEIRLKQKTLQKSSSEFSLQSETDETPQFVIPQLKKAEKIEKNDTNIYCSGEPMEVEEAEDTKESNGLPEKHEEVLSNGDIGMNDRDTMYGLYKPNNSDIDNDVTDDELCNIEIKNSKRHRKRRKALSST